MSVSTNLKHHAGQSLGIDIRFLLESLFDLYAGINTIVANKNLEILFHLGWSV